MKPLSSDDITTLVAKAFTLEALTDKPGCTTRYHDLPGKPLTDFVMAGLNAAPYFGMVVGDAARGDKALLAHNLGALQASNTHKSSKYVNFGLLEIMFIAVRARLETNDIDQVADVKIRLIKDSTNDDVAALLGTRRLAWSTSQTDNKIDFRPGAYEQLASMWDFYQAMLDNYDPDTAHHQWSADYQHGLPILRRFLAAYDASVVACMTSPEAS